MKLAWKISGVAAAAVAGFYIITLDNIDNIWQYAICLACVIYLLFLLLTNWDAVVRWEQDHDDEIVDIWEHQHVRKK